MSDAVLDLARNVAAMFWPGTSFGLMPARRVVLHTLTSKRTSISFAEEYGRSAPLGEVPSNSCSVADLANEVTTLDEAERVGRALESLR